MNKRILIASLAIACLSTTHLATAGKKTEKVQKTLESARKKVWRTKKDVEKKRKIYDEKKAEVEQRLGQITQLSKLHTRLQGKYNTAMEREKKANEAALNKNKIKHLKKAIKILKDIDQQIGNVVMKELDKVRSAQELVRTKLEEQKPRNPNRYARNNPELKEKVEDRLAMVEEKAKPIAERLSILNEMKATLKQVGVSVGVGGQVKKMLK